MKMEEYTLHQKVYILPQTWEALRWRGIGEGSLGARLLLDGDKPDYTNTKTPDEWLALRRKEAEQHTIKITPRQRKTLLRWAKEDDILQRGKGNMSLYLDIILS